MEFRKHMKYLLLFALLALSALAQDNDSSSTSPRSTSTTQTTASRTSTQSSSSASSRSTSSVSTERPPSLTSSSDVTSSTTTSSRGTSLPPKPTLSDMPSYPPPTVPPTANAPFMQQSSLPEGTFFIAVGAALGFLLFSVFAWRALVAWSLHRSVKRAAEQANKVDQKAPLRPAQNAPSAGFYAAGAGSSVSLGDLGATRGGGSKQTPNSSLFFSPTAGVSSSGGDRRSTYLPAGYYPNSGGGVNASQTHFHSQSVSSRHGYGGFGGSRGGLAPSPPGSPSMPPSRGGNGSGMLPQLRASVSNTSLSLPPQAGQRAPSAYLEDLFEHHNQQPGGRY